MEPVKPDEMWKEYVEHAPEALMEFLLFCYQKYQGKHLPPGVEVDKITILSSEFARDKKKGDALLLVDCSRKHSFQQCCEFQSTFDAWMNDRNWNYCASGRKKHWQTYRNLPLASAVIYGPKVKPPRNRKPYTWKDPFEGDGNTMDFNNLRIYLAEIPFVELRALNNPLHWPILVQTNGNIDCIILAEMFDQLAEEPYRRMWTVAFDAVYWYRPQDHEWLEKEYRTVYNGFITDVPAFKEEVAKEVVKKNLVQARQTVIDFIEVCYPSLLSLANKQVDIVANAEVLKRTQRKLFKAHDDVAAQEILLALSNEAEAK